MADKVEIKIVAAGASYFRKEVLRDADGEPRKNPAGDEIKVDVRLEALHGDVIEVSEYEASRLRDLGVAIDKDEEPSRVTFATPFGAPAPTYLDDDDDETVMAAAPPVAQVHGVTPDEARSRVAAIQSQHAEDAEYDELTGTVRSSGSGSENEGSDVDLSDLGDDELEAYVSGNSVTTVLNALRDEDGDIDETQASRVLEVEQTREKPRSSLVEPLEEAVTE